ncbi:acetyl-CoA acetyltransferase [Gordonia sp. X0973]|uniref:acetyl-CoA acetyltransferase n=1 Tax=Gordonia sp. X0973 TaxID=2742602 RepID=UPI000F52C722|nr:acetyl-CoA acetyltransferase [Gordonia sp. X0973]QKT06529.1 acetyl-CoA acetyltransferase [Gordonia sp. X0973]
MTHIDDAALDPTTPVLVGVGQFSERLDDPGYRALSAVDLGAQAALAAIADAGLAPTAVADLDVIVGVRQFEVSHARAVAPLGRSDNYPRSVADRVGVDPARAVYDVVGGDSPQRLVAEFGALIAAGEIETALLVGSEAMSTTRHFAGRDDAPDFTEARGGQLEDRGYEIEDMITPSQVRYGIIGPPSQYALLEHARRARVELSREEYAATMGELFAPLTEVAASNPHSAAPVRRSAAELVEVTAKNRMVADPLPRFLVARDQVNQGAAVLLMSLGRARELGVDPRRWVFLHGYAKARAPRMIERPEMGESPTAAAALNGALESAGVGIDAIDFLDIYSCFPVAVFAATDALGLASDDPRGLTLTGGLPYFGGAGNNYSMHAIAEAVDRVRTRPGSRALVAANGGIISKYAVGIYSTTPRAWQPGVDPQPALDAVPCVETVDEYDGESVVETFTIVPFGGAEMGVLVCRNASGTRFFAQADPDDEKLAEILATGEPLGQRVRTRVVDGKNLAALY